MFWVQKQFFGSLSCGLHSFSLVSAQEEDRYLDEQNIGKGIPVMPFDKGTMLLGSYFSRTVIYEFLESPRTITTFCSPFSLFMLSF